MCCRSEKPARSGKRSSAGSEARSSPADGSAGRHPSSRRRPPPEGEAAPFHSVLADAAQHVGRVARRRRAFGMGDTTNGTVSRCSRPVWKGPVRSSTCRLSPAEWSVSSSRNPKQNRIYREEARLSHLHLRRFERLSIQHRKSERTTALATQTQGDGCIGIETTQSLRKPG